MPKAQTLLRLLQLVSPTLPVGAFSYSEGLETLIHEGKITEAASLEDWLVQELSYGAVRVEAAVLYRAYEAAIAPQPSPLNDWNQWLSAFRETEELREQSAQMGRSLSRLFQTLEPGTTERFVAAGEPCNFAIAFAIAAAHWNIDPHSAVLGYLHSWASNLVNAGVRLIPLGQTAGQALLLRLYPVLEATTTECLQLRDEELGACGWGLAIASMNHETLYTRLFRS